MNLLPNEEIVKFSFNLPPQAFDGMKTDMRLFGSRTKTALKTDLRGRLDEKRKNNQVEVLLDRLLEGLGEYKSAIYNNFGEYNVAPEKFNSEKNFTAFWHLMNTFLLDLVERPENVDSVLLEKPVQEVLSPYFEEIGYLVEFYIHTLFSDWFPYYTVTVAKLLSRQQMSEQLFGYPITYTLEHIHTLRPAIIFGVSSFFDPRNTRIRIDHSMTETTCHEYLYALKQEEKEFVEAASKKPYNETVLEHILFHEKMHCLFHKIKGEHYSQGYTDPAAVFNFLMLSEAWARLATLYLSNGAIIYELNSLLGLKATGDPVYCATSMFLQRSTSIYKVFENTGQSLDVLIESCRSHAIRSLKMTADWMNRYLIDEPDSNWYELIRLMQTEYAKDLSSDTLMSKKYKPKLYEIK
jgi:hypothetical protein